MTTVGLMSERTWGGSRKRSRVAVSAFTLLSVSNRRARAAGSGVESPGRSSKPKASRILDGGPCLLACRRGRCPSPIFFYSPFSMCA
ncbi:hypothetical protein LX36DRAFT_159224 [Colletotrichum falcatum]|nr:hypothetical protein LX36DRAFT_159224 [Colletotrichum falcatum]